jgi:hypothetical protein
MRHYARGMVYGKANPLARGPLIPKLKHRWCGAISFCPSIRNAGDGREHHFVLFHAGVRVSIQGAAAAVLTARRKGETTTGKAVFFGCFGPRRVTRMSSGNSHPKPGRCEEPRDHGLDGSCCTLRTR